MGRLGALLALADSRDTLLPLVVDVARGYGVDPALVAAVVEHESGWNPGAHRPEPQLQDASYGLMQVLLSTARGYRPGVTPSDLFIPSVNVDVGVRYLRHQLDRYGNVPDAVAAYNAGSARKDALGRYVNSQGVPNVQAYVTRVLHWFDYYRANFTPADVVTDEAAGPDLPLEEAAGVALAAVAVLAVVTLARRRRRAA